MRLTTYDKAKIDKHITKATTSYNAIGVPRINFVVYYNGPNWLDFWDKYSNYVQTLTVGTCSPTQQPYSPRNLKVRMERLIYDDGHGVQIHVCHLAINMLR